MKRVSNGVELTRREADMLAEILIRLATVAPDIVKHSRNLADKYARRLVENNYRITR